MQTATATILGLCLLGLSWMAIREFARGKWIRDLKALAVQERNRNRFGELRTALMSMARDGAIDVRGERFQTIYGSLTILMRNPHDYEKAAWALLALPEHRTVGMAPITKSEGELMLLLADRLDLLCRDYNALYRSLAWVLDHARGGSSNPLHQLPLWLQVHLRQAERARPIIQARTRLKMLGSETVAAA